MDLKRLEFYSIILLKAYDRCKIQSKLQYLEQQYNTSKI